MLCLKFVCFFFKYEAYAEITAIMMENNGAYIQNYNFDSQNALALYFLIINGFGWCYMTTGKTIALIRWTFVGKVISLLFNMLSRLIITFLPRSKCLLISWLQSPSVVILEPIKIKSDTVSPSICHEVMGPDAMILVFWMLF